jgi:[ribosomal protein S5]-alanine N-acetyltransferase
MPLEAAAAMSLTPNIVTARLVLRPFRIEDAPAVRELAGAVEVYRTTLNIPHPYEDGMAEKWIASLDAIFDEGSGVTLAMTLKPTGMLIGSIRLGVTQPHRRGELGYWVGVPHWGRGYCTEAAIATVEYGFKELGLHKIAARHMAGNPASGRIMEKIGMVREGVLRKEVVKDGEFHDMVYYGVLASEFSIAAARRTE